jgi:uncharacterized paraquat-inducible protein A
MKLHVNSKRVKTRTIECPHCDHEFKYDTTVRYRRIMCPRCEKWILSKREDSSNNNKVVY